MNWNTDIKAAPHGRYVVKQRKEGVDTRVFVPEWVILTTKCGKVTRSHYQPEVKRWLMLADGELPLAWMPWPEPYSNSGGMVSGRIDPSADHVSPPASQAASGGESANEGGDYVNPQALPTLHKGNASLAAREGEKPLHLNSPPLAHETRGGAGDDCSVGKRGVWPPQGGASSSRALNDIGAEQVVTGGESAAIEHTGLPSGAAACSADTAGTEPPPSVPADQFESEAEAEIARLERVIEKSGGIGNALSAMLGVDVEIVRADGGADITMKHSNIAGAA